MSLNYIGSSWINIYKRNIFKNLEFPLGKIYEDVFILPYIITRIKIAYVSNFGYYYYCQRNDSITQSKNNLNNWLDILDCYILHLNYCKSCNFNRSLLYNKFKLYHHALFNSIIDFKRNIPEKYISDFSIIFKYIKLKDIIINEKCIINKILIMKILGLRLSIFFYKIIYSFKSNRFLF